MSDKLPDATRRAALKGIATGAAVGLGVVSVSSTAAADDCQIITWCDNNCPFNEPRVAQYECCDGDEMFEDCTLISEDCGVMCP